MNMEKILEIAQQQIDIFDKLGKVSKVKKLNEIVECYQSLKFKVLITGTHGKGKSTLINAILGKEILKTSIIPVDTRNIIKGGEINKAKVDSKDEIALEKICDLETTSTVELTWDSDFFSDGIELVEYPSMTSPANLSEFQTELNQSDYIVLVVSCDALFPITESNAYKDYIKPSGHELPIVIANFTDLISSKDFEDVKRSAFVRLPTNKDKIFFMSTQSAFDGEEDSNKTLQLVLKKITTSAANRRVLKSKRLRKVLSLEVDNFLSSMETENINEENIDDSVESNITIWRDRLKSIQNLSLRIQKNLNEFRYDNSSIIERKLSYYFQELNQKIKKWGINEIGRDFEEEISKKINIDFQDFIKTDLKPYLKQQFQGQEELLISEFKQYNQALHRLYDSLPTDIPTVDLEINSNNQFSIPNNASLKDLKEGNPKNKFRIQSLLEAPKAIITLAGSIIGGALYTQLAPVIIPAGIGLSMFFAKKDVDEKYYKSAISKFQIQVKEQGHKLKNEILSDVNKKMDNLQSQVAILLNNTTGNGEADVMKEIKRIKNQTNEKNYIKEKLKQIKIELQSLN